MTEQKISWLEREDADFPYYEGQPVPVGNLQWIVVMIAVAAGFYALTALQQVFPSGLAGFIPAIAFVAIPLGVLAFFAGSAWTALFRRMRRVDWLLIVAFFVLNWIVTIVVGMLAVALFDAQANPAGSILAGAGLIDRVLFFAKAIVQLLGEEIFTILPFLAILTWLVSTGISRTVAIIIAALVASAIFALVHLPTYQWNWGQCLVALAPIRVVLLLPYLITKNIWVSTGVHVANDWAIFGLPFLLGGSEAVG